MDGNCVYVLLHFLSFMFILNFFVSIVIMFTIVPISFNMFFACSTFISPKSKALTPPSLSILVSLEDYKTPWYMYLHNYFPYNHVLNISTN